MLKLYDSAYILDEGLDFGQTFEKKYDESRLNNHIKITVDSKGIFIPITISMRYPDGKIRYIYGLDIMK